MIYFSSEKNKDLFSDFTEELDIKLENENCFSYYLENKRKQFDDIKFLVLDLEFLTDSESEILESVYKVKMLNRDSLRIIIVALNKKAGDVFLGKLFAENIFDIITEKNEIESSIKKQTSYKTAIKYKVNFEEVEESKEKENVLRNIFENIKRDKSDKIGKKNIEKEVSYKEKLPKESKEEVNIDIEEIKEVQKKEITTKDTVKSVIKEESKRNKSLEEQIDDIFGNSNFLIHREEEKKEREYISLEKTSEELSFLFYYNRKIGIYEDGSCICVIDNLFDKEEIRNYLENIRVKYVFKDDIYSKIKNLSM